MRQWIEPYQGEGSLPRLQILLINIMESIGSYEIYIDGCVEFDVLLGV